MNGTLNLIVSSAITAIVVATHYLYYKAHYGFTCFAIYFFIFIGVLYLLENNNEHNYVGEMLKELRKDNNRPLK